MTAASRLLVNAIATLSILLPPASGLAAGPDARHAAGSANTAMSATLLAETRAARDRKDFTGAEALARSGLQRFPGEAVWPILLALILSDEGRGNEALALLATPGRVATNEWLIAHAYASRRVGRPFDALRDYFAVLARDPKNAEARSEAAIVLRDIRAPWAAAQFSAEPLPLPLAADEAAAEVRWGTQDVPVDPRHRFDGTDRALATLDALIARARSEGNGDVEMRLRLDRMVALRDRVRMDDVVAEAKVVQSAGHSLPTYAQEALADALLYLRQPEAARAEYEAVLETDPTNHDARIGRIYASVEMEDFAAAYAQADDLLKSEPEWQRFAEDPSKYPNEKFVDAVLLAAAVRYYGDQPDEAWTRIVPLRDGAPRNPYIRLGAASIMNGRDWPHAAEQENRIALTLSPSLLAAQIAVAEAALARNRMDEARARIAELAELYPENLQVRRLQDELAAKTGWQFETEFRPAHEKGGGTFGNSGNELNASAQATSPLIGESWHLFAGYSYANAHPPEGFVDLERNTVGAQLTLPDLSASAAVTESFGTLSRTGMSGTIDWSPGDDMKFAIAGERISSETPLRALLHDITADSLSTRFTYTWDEAHQASIGASWLPFTDGNERASVSARYTQKIVAIPHFGLDLTAELYGSTNSLANVSPYYSPAADGSATVRTEAVHTIWRRYETSFVQALTLEGGWYGERDFKGGPIGTATYEQRWRFDPWAELVYGGYISERMYDGDGARVIGAFITLRRRV